jgi:hypothetical protein
LSRLASSLVLAVGGALSLAGCSRSPGGATEAPAVPAAAAPAPTRPTGPRAGGEAFLVALEPPGAARASAQATARVVVTARGTYHVNRDYPMSFRPDPASTATFPSEKVALGEGAARTACKDQPDEVCTVSAPLAFTAPDSGEARIAGTVAFSVCNADRCLIEKVPVSAAVPAR